MGTEVNTDLIIYTNGYSNERFKFTSGGDFVSIGTNSSIRLVSDAGRLYLGTGTDASIHYDGTKLNIISDLVSASDLSIDCGTDKTLVLAESVWNDIQFNISSGRTAASNFPDWEPFTANTSEYQFDVDDYIDLGAQEMMHDWKEGTSIYPHIHVATDSANSTGSSRYAKFTIYIAYADENNVFTETPKDIEIVWNFATQGKPKFKNGEIIGR
jgi:hypothetical protein